jgi:hypothetical protein
MVLYGPIAHWFVIPAFFIAITEFILNKKNRKVPRSSAVLIVTVLLYWLIYVAEGLFVGYNDELLFNIQVKSTLVYFTIAFAFGSNDKNFFRQIVKVFLFAVFLKIPLSFIYAYLNSHEYVFSEFSYVRLAYDGHPSYISFYSIIAFTLLLVYVINREVKTFNFQFLFEILGLFSLSIYIIFLSSKAGVISWIIVCLLVLFKGVLIPNSRRFVIQVLGILLLFTSSTVILFPQLISRFTGIEKVVTNTEILKEGNDSNASRVKLWIAATNLWKEKPVFGQGVNGVNDKLYENIVLSGYEMDRRFNTHNQFLNELVIHGVFGILSIVLIVSVFSYFISNDWWYRILTFLVLLVELGVECMFNRQAGVVIFGMMMGVLMIKLKDINNA